jgi:hypothetical protein
MVDVRGPKSPPASQAAIYVFGVRFDPPQDRREHCLYVIQFSGANLIQLQLGDFVVKMHQPIPVAGKTPQEARV